MGEPKFLTTLSKTSWESSSLLFKSGTCPWILFKRLHFTVVGTMSRWTAEISFFAGRSDFRAAKFHGKCASHHFSVATMTWGGRWSAINVLCEALFGQLFRILRAPHFMRRKFSKVLFKAFEATGAFRRLPKTFSRRMKIFHFSSFFMKFNIK